MDPWALAVANILAGNPPAAAALELALGGGAMRWESGGMFALAGAQVDATLDGVSLVMRTTYRAAAGSVLTIERFIAGRFAYLALEGGIDVPLVLGSRATYLPGRFGGVEGHLVRSGDRLPLMKREGASTRVGFTVPPELLPESLGPTCGVVPGPFADEQFGADAWARLTSEPFRVEASSDRMGYRLSGPGLGGEGLGTLPSAPMCLGAVQVPNGGQPIVLMLDGPTVGGYPVIGVVSAASLATLAQRVPGEEIRFAAVTLTEAHRHVRRMASAVHTLEHLVAHY
jgi:biotin-dependent carboxylase-like uncharacterized protein